MTRPDIREPAELTGIADRSLSGRRLRKAEGRVAASPELRAELERQRVALAALRSVDLAAPPGLRERIEVERARARRPARRRRWALGGALAAAAVLALFILVPGGPGAPTVVEASELAQLPPTEPAPDRGRPKLLDVSAFGLFFPDWAKRFGWEASGVRRDEIDGRGAVTVFYEKGGRRIGYTILSGAPIAAPEGAEAALREGTPLRHLSDGGRLIVTWSRADLTCILSGSGVELDVLLDLAGWKAPAP